MLLVTELFFLKKEPGGRVLQAKLVCTGSFTVMPEHFSINIQDAEFHLDECRAKRKLNHCWGLWTAWNRTREKTEEENKL